MGRSFTIFRLLGFPIKLHPSWLIIVVLLVWTLGQGFFPVVFPGLTETVYWAMAAAGSLGLFLSIILHELGHAVAARRFGIPMKGITLFIFGGVAEMGDEPPTAKAEFYMAIAGPAVSVLLTIVFLLIHVFGTHLGWPGPVTGVFYYLGLINGVLIAFNMLPAFPLDGGRVFRSILWARRGSLRRATRTASKVGSGFGIALIALGVLSVVTGSVITGIWWFVLGLFLRAASQSSYQHVQVRRALQGEAVRRFMKDDPVTVSPGLSVQDFVQDYAYRHPHEMYPVVDGSRLLGCVTTRQVKELPREEWPLRKVSELVAGCSDNNTVSPEMDAMDLLSAMRQTGNSRFLVVENGRLAGIISLKDMLRFLALKLDLEGDDKDLAAKAAKALST